MQRKIFDQKTTAVKIGFEWWGIYGWLGLTLGNIFLFIQLDNHIGIAIFSIIINSIMMIMILKFNKYAFLIATILSLNPIIWIINGIYLKNRWLHPKINTHATAKLSKKIGKIARSTTPFSNTNELSAEQEENAYERAALEIESDGIKKGLWAKSFAEANGIESVAKAYYIKARSEQLMLEIFEESKNEARESNATANNTSIETTPTDTPRDRQRAMDELIGRMHRNT